MYANAHGRRPACVSNLRFFVVSSWVPGWVIPIFLESCQLPSLKLTASLPLKINGWKMKDFLLGLGLCSGAFAVSFRECIAWIFVSKII